jgi:glycosyltransferase involved in cell wall biosynthesis
MQSFKIWIVEQGEPLPFPAGERGNRLMRAGILAQTLAGRGHDVTWWTSAFNHQLKAHASDQDASMRTEEGFTLRLIWSPGYARHISLQRYRDHRILAHRLKAAMDREEAPHLILCGLPIPELAGVCADYGRRNTVPVVVDIRDWWPDIFYLSLPGPLRPLGKLFTIPMAVSTRRGCRGASALTAVTPEFLRWGLAKAGRQASDKDAVFHLGYPSQPLGSAVMEEGRQFWSSLGVTSDSHILLYLGMFNQTFDLDTIVDAASLLQQGSCPARFLLCGDGDKGEEYRQKAKGLKNVLFPGWINQAQIRVIMEMATAGLAPYPDREDFRCQISNKAIEYLSHGLPVLSSPANGALSDFLKENHCGMTYRNGRARELASLVEYVCRHSDLRREMSANALRVFQKCFDAQKVYGAMADHLEKLIEFRSPVPLPELQDVKENV